MVKHVLGKDESQVRFLLRAPSAFAYATARLVSQKLSEDVELEKRMSRCNERSECKRTSFLIIFSTIRFRLCRAAAVWPFFLSNYEHNNLLPRGDYSKDLKKYCCMLSENMILYTRT